ncbi:hypothetical protein LINPERHAP2_LOCUS25035 [Linum perenne]
MGTKGQKRSATNKANRAVQEIYHTHGSKPFNITQEEKEKDKGGPISRGDLFLATHKAGKKEWLNKETQDMYKSVASDSGAAGNVPKHPEGGRVHLRLLAGRLSFGSSNGEEKAPDQQDDTEYLEEVVLSPGGQENKKKRKKRKGKGNA